MKSKPVDLENEKQYKGAELLWIVSEILPVLFFAMSVVGE